MVNLIYKVLRKCLFVHVCFEFMSKIKLHGFDSHKQKVEISSNIALQQPHYHY